MKRKNEREYRDDQRKCTNGPDVIAVVEKQQHGTDGWNERDDSQDVGCDYAHVPFCVFCTLLWLVAVISKTTQRLQRRPIESTLHMCARIRFACGARPFRFPEQLRQCR